MQFYDFLNKSFTRPSWLQVKSKPRWLSHLMEVLPISVHIYIHQMHVVTWIGIRSLLATPLPLTQNIPTKFTHLPILH